MKKYKVHTWFAVAIVLIAGATITWIIKNPSAVVSDADAAVTSISAPLITYKNTTGRSNSSSNFGYNGLFIEGLMKNKAKNINYNVIAIDRVMTATGAAWLRFVGGTRANSYVWDPAAPGLGDDTSFDKLFTNNFLVNYADIAKALDAKTDYVIDIAAHFPYYYGGTQYMPPRLKNKTDAQIIAMNVDAVRYLIEHGVPSHEMYIELGNELYYTNLTQNMQANATGKTYDQVVTAMKPAMDRYESLVNQYIAAFNALGREKGTTFKFGVPFLMPYATTTTPFTGSLANRNTYWDARMAALPVNAVVIHNYSNLAVCKSIVNNNTTFRDCLRQKDDEDVRNMPISIDRTRSLYPGKELWFTEYGSGLGYSADPQLDNSGYVDSPDEIKYLKDITNVFKSKQVEFYTLHALYASQGKNYVVMTNLNQTGATKVLSETDMYVLPIVCAFIPTNSAYYSIFNCH